jgi:uncharacterized protein
MHELEQALSELPATLRTKVESCAAVIRPLGRLAVAFSGGVDSSFVLALAAQVLGAENVLAIMAVGPVFPRRDRTGGESLTVELGVELVQIEGPDLSETPFTTNPPDRCYHCKQSLLGRLVQFAAERGFEAVATGANADDAADFRPGSRAEQELGVVRPLLTAGLTKADIRAASRAMGLATWDQPAIACLATRIPYGQAVTQERIARIASAEEALNEMGFDGCRVRDHETVARVELPADDMPVALELREAIVGALKQAGYAYVALDLEGLRTGSMNETLGEEILGGP